jgi:hypothetical protein
MHVKAEGRLSRVNAGAEESYSNGLELADRCPHVAARRSGSDGRRKKRPSSPNWLGTRQLRRPQHVEQVRIFWFAWKPMSSIAEP